MKKGFGLLLKQCSQDYRQIFRRFLTSVFPVSGEKGNELLSICPNLFNTVMRKKSAMKKKTVIVFALQFCISYSNLIKSNSVID